MPRSASFDRSPIALLAFLVPLAFYVASLCLYPAAWDTAEMQTAPYVLGIPHPTGFPLFVMAGWLFSHIVAFGTVAWRLNFFSAVALAATAGMVYQTARALGAPRAGGLFGSFIFAAGKVVWDKAYQVDVHALATLCTAVALYFLVRFLDSHEERSLYAAALANGLGLAVHPNAIWTIPAIVVAYVAVSYLTWRTSLVVLACLLGPLVLYAYEPLRSVAVAAGHLDPVQSLPWPDGVRPLSLIWDTNQTRTLGGLKAQLLASQTNPVTTLVGIVSVWRYPSFAVFWWGYAAAEFGIAALIAAGVGAVCLVKCNPKAALLLFVLGFAAVPTAVTYSDREGDIARYFLASFVVVAIFAALLPLVGTIVPRLRALGPLWAGVLLLLAWHVTDDNRYHLDARTGTGSQAVIDLGARAIPPNSIVFTSWIDATSLAYGQDIEGVLKDRIIVPRGPGEFEPTIAVWSRLRPVYVFADWFVNPELKTMPAGWVSEPTHIGLGRYLYRLCADPNACR